MHCIRSLIVTAFIVFFINVSMAEAEPNPNIKYLMNDSVSMLDWGLYRIEKDVEATLEDPAGYGLNTDTIIDSSPVYDWDKNRIIVGVHVSKAISLEQAKSWCRKIVRMVRTTLNVSPDTGEPFPSLDQNGGALYSFFSHAGYTKKSEPKGLSKELDNITWINIKVEVAGMKEPLNCEAALLGTDILFPEAALPETDINN
jgi:hypothetical protein